MNQYKWYSDGLKFECTGCGGCCTDHGEYAYVYLLQPEIEAIAEYLELSVDDFRQKYCLHSDELVYLKMETPDCLFFKNGKCVIYPVRPKQCRTWPFWKDNLDKETWDNDVKPFCPGIGKGKRFSPEEIDSIAEKGEEGFEESL